MLLVYYRLYITHTLAGFLFDLDQSNICRDMQKIEPLVRECVPIPQKMHRLSKRLRTPEKRLKGISLAFCPSQTARNSRYTRPENRRRRKTYYSGKKKRHTVKTQLMVNNQGLIIHKTNHKKGKRHDYDLQL